MFRTIGSFQHNAFKLAEMATEEELGRTYLNTLAAEYIRIQIIRFKSFR